MDNRIKFVRFHLTCELGKVKLGEGDNSIGDLIPGYFAEAQLEDIRVRLSDKATSLFPPYSTPEQKVFIQHEEEWSEKEMWIADKTETLRLYKAGGGADAEFTDLWSEVIRQGKKCLQAKRAQTYHSGGGNMVYLVSGRRR